MIRSEALRLLPVERAYEPAGRAVSIIDQLLAAQRDLSAVERFAQVHDGGLDGAARSYSELLPAAPPAPGQQYAFHVDLDRCSGCKACVTACHSLNGLDEGEVWRTVGLVHGGSAEAPVSQTVTTSCHHCLEPACMAGCPVGAYEKDPVTGIVSHLDDQCFGCQYCTLMCPYDAPKYSASRGIVRKCDMCAGRLAVGEAPACVQACPSQAIRITVIERAQALEDAEAGQLVAGAAPPGGTVPTTVYATKRALPRNLLPADYYRVERQHAHLPLVVMLVLTQLSVGAFVAAALLALLGGARATVGAAGALPALLVGLLAMSASVMHLGRPQYAFRALIGLRTSWLSREIAAFSLFAGAAAATALSLRMPALAGWSQSLLLTTAGIGVGAVGCSVMVYVATRRPLWSGVRVSLRFYGSMAALGVAGLLAVSTVTGTGSARLLAAVLVAAAALKLANDAMALRHLRARSHSPEKRAAILLVGDLKPLAMTRFLAGAIGGVAVPLTIVLAEPGAQAPAVVGVLALVGTLAGELCERALFFAASAAPRMPGGAA